jgi:hypothetical protein
MVALVVGTVLNLINQGDALIAGQHIIIVKVVLTYMVPYCVATYGAVSFRLMVQNAADRRKAFPPEGTPHVPLRPRSGGRG